MPNEVVIERRAAQGVVYWTGIDWSDERSQARLYPDATTCPRTLPLGGSTRAVRRINRYWVGSICWALVEDASPAEPERHGHASAGTDAR